jgi:hypothetical protein
VRARSKKSALSWLAHGAEKLLRALIVLVAKRTPSGLRMRAHRHVTQLFRTARASACATSGLSTVARHNHRVFAGARSY